MNGWCRHYGKAPASVEVAGNDPEDGRWLGEALHPWPETSGPGRLRVRVQRSDARHRVLGRRFAAVAPTLETIPCFSLDTRTVALPALAAGERLWLADPETDCFFGLRRASGRLDLVAPFDTPHARLGLLRLVRELLTGAILAAGAVLDLHAAACVSSARGLLLVGPKGAGKTSLLCHLLGAGGVALLGNDRAFLHLDPGRTLVRGVPTMVAIRPGTLESFPVLRIRRGGEPAAPAGPGDSPRRYLTLAGFAARLGAVCLPEAPLHAIIRPQLCADLTTWSLERLSVAAAGSLLATCRYGTAAARTVPTLLAGLAGEGRTAAPVSQPGSLRGLLEDLAQRVPVYRCRLGPEAYRGSARPLLQALGL